MISNSEFEVLKLLINNLTIDETKYETEISTLKKEKLINPIITHSDNNYVYYNGFSITSLGKRAYEEYLAFIESQNRESETLKVAKEANQISIQANELSKNANKKSSKANTLSLIAIIVPSLISLAALIVSVLAYIYK